MKNRENMKKMINRFGWLMVTLYLWYFLGYLAYLNETNDFLVSLTIILLFIIAIQLYETALKIQANLN